MIAIDFEQFAKRMLTEAMIDATAVVYRRRAAHLEAAQHRPGIDFAGRAADDELRGRRVGLAESAKACRARATVGLAEDVPELIEYVFSGVRR